MIELNLQVPSIAWPIPTIDEDPFYHLDSKSRDNA